MQNRARRATVPADAPDQAAPPAETAPSAETAPPAEAAARVVLHLLEELVKHSRPASCIMQFKSACIDGGRRFCSFCFQS